jgi:hypothetical protein
MHVDQCSEWCTGTVTMFCAAVCCRREFSSPGTMTALLEPDIDVYCSALSAMHLTPYLVLLKHRQFIFVSMSVMRTSRFDVCYMHLLVHVLLTTSFYAIRVSCCCSPRAGHTRIHIHLRMMNTSEIQCCLCRSFRRVIIIIIIMCCVCRLCRCIIIIIIIIIMIMMSVHDVTT